MIAGAMSGIATFQLFDAGLVAGPSPGSIFAYLALTPRGNFIGIILGVLVATVVSFIVTSIILKLDKNKDDDSDALTTSMEKSQTMKSEGKNLYQASTDAQTVTTQGVSKISFVCDAGAGSSALGATTFRKKLKSAGLEGIEVKHYRIEDAPKDSDIIVVHQNLLDRARLSFKDHDIITIENYIGDPKLEDLLNRRQLPTT